MKPVRVFHVIPTLPTQLQGLRELAYNLRWAWDHDTIELFRRLDSDLWESSGHNPVRMLGLVDQAQFETVARDEAFLSHLERCLEDLHGYRTSQSTWFHRTYGKAHNLLVAYFSAEFGVTECLSIFAGGLGVLAGDHLKSASDLGIPLVGVSLLYQQGYFRQYLDAAGWQQESYEENDFRNMPLQRERTDAGSPLTVQVNYDGRVVMAEVWRATAGRVSLYLLDANLPVNAPEDRDITDQLYGGDREMRLKQEILLGIGGFRALVALGLTPTVCHMNEGHSALLSLEWVRHLMERRRLSFAEAREVASSGLVFTGHTPVPAGHDYFSGALIQRYLSEYARGLGISMVDLLALGREHPDRGDEEFCMTVLAMRMAASSNGVSKLHGQVSRRMWNAMWPGVPEDEVPIGHVTNGVHLRSWISFEMNQLYDRYLGPKWREEHADSETWKRVENVPAEELWRTHERRRERLVAFARRRLRLQLERRGAPQSEIHAAEEVLDPDALTIGFARRFATYKRATLLLHDPARLEGILSQTGRPVQILFAGKAHPRDDAGKALIQQIVRLAQQKEFRRRIVFLEDYDMAVARYLVQGSDVWLNTPLRPMEASGTSGMKAMANGALNVSTLDGWWDEAWRDAASRHRFIGWAIGRGETDSNPDRQDQVEAAALYTLLEREIVPTFYERGADGLPRRWIASMKSAIATLCPQFNMQRAGREYAADFYAIAYARYEMLTAEDGARSRALARWTAHISANWNGVRIESVDGPAEGDVAVGDHLTVRVQLHLGALSPEDVAVELYLGRLNANGDFADTLSLPMRLTGSDNGSFLYEAATVPCNRSGLHGYTVRVMPFHPDEARSMIPGLIAWA